MNYRSRCTGCMRMNGQATGPDGLADLEAWAKEHEAETGHRVEIIEVAPRTRKRVRRNPDGLDSLRRMF